MNAIADKDPKGSARAGAPDAGAAGRRRRIDRATVAFGLATMALAASTVGLLAAGESEWPMFALALGGILTGRLLGLSQWKLAVLSVVVMLLGWPIAFFTSPVPRATSTFAHIGVSAVLAWVVADPIRRRWPGARARPWSLRWFLVPAVVLAIGGLWEVGEWVADAVFGTDLALDALDTALDLVADLLGAVAGLALHDRVRRPTATP